MLLAAWLRLRNIGGPEPFVDEGANILTALDARVRVAFEPLAQGRPGLIWLFKPAGWAPAHALEIARIMSAGAGLVTVMALGWSLYQLAGKMAALCGMLFWALLPLAVFHERLALQDPFIAALLAGTVALFTTGTLQSGQRLSWAWFVGAGVLFGTAFLLKISAALALPWLALIYWAVRHDAARPLLDYRAVQIALGAIIPLASLGPGWLALGSKLDRYSALAVAGDTALLPAWLGRMQTWAGYYASYGGWSLIILALVALIVVVQTRARLALACGAGWLIAALGTGLFYHHTFARYTLTDHLPLIFFLALLIGRTFTTQGTHKTIVAILLVTALASWGRTSWQIATDPAGAGVPLKDVDEYFSGAWSGRGLTGVKQYLTAYADTHQVSCLVLTHQFLRPGCYGLMLAELGDARIGVVPLTVYEAAELEAARPILRRTAAGQPVAFFILYEGSLYPRHPWLDSPSGLARRVHEVPRGPGESFTLYQFEP